MNCIGESLLKKVWMKVLFLKLMKMKTVKKDLMKSKKYIINFYLKKLYL